MYSYLLIAHFMCCMCLNVCFFSPRILLLRLPLFVSLMLIRFSSANVWFGLVWFLLKLFSSSSESGTHNHLWNGACWLTPSTRACNSISCLHVCFHSLFLVCSWRFIYIYFCGKETQKVAQQVTKFAINISLNCRNNAVMTTMTRDGCSGATGC